MTRFGRRDPAARLRRLVTGKRAPAEGPPRRLRVVGHRGAPRVEAENTIPSFAAALDLGADAVEADVCVTRDDHFVIWHDNEPGDPTSLARGIGAESYAYRATWPNLLDPKRRPVYEMTLAEMREVCAYVRQGDEATVPFALLEDLWTWSAGEPRLQEVFLDIKLRPEQADRVPLLLERLAPRRPDLPVRLLLPERELWQAGSAAPRDGVVLTADFEAPGVLEDVAELGIRHVSLGYTPLRAWADFQRELAEVVEARDDGELDSITVWTINDEERLRALADARIDAVLTDAPELLR